MWLRVRAALVVVCSCSLVTDLTDLGNQADGGPADVTSEPSVDAASPVDASDGGFCATHPGHTLCADFDNGALLPGFSTESTYNGGNVGLADVFYSAPYAMHGWEGPVTDAYGASGRLELSLPLSLSSIRVEAELKICDRSGFTMTSEDIVQFSCDGPNGAYGGYGFSIESAGDLVMVRPVTDGGVVFQDQVLSTFTGAGWHHLLLTLAFGNPGHVHFELDGIVGFDHDEPVLCENPVSTQLQFGASAYGVSPKCDVYLDNILADVH